MNSDGIILECRGKSNWPLLGPSSCPVEKLETLIDKNVSILHDQSNIFEIKSDNKMILNYDAFVWRRNIGVIIATVLLLVSMYVFKQACLFDRSLKE